MGGADEGIPVDVVREFERALEEAGVEHEIVIYDGAPHSFFDRKFEQFADASERRVAARARLRRAAHAPDALVSAPCPT